MDFVKSCLNFEQNDATFVELITPEQPTVEMHQADIVIKVRFNGKEILAHFEFQTTDSYDPEMALRMAGYIIRLEETMHQPSIIEYWTEKATAEAHQQGIQQGAKEDILEALALRLQPDAARTFKPALEAIDDLERLKQLFRAAILANSMEDFRQALESNESSATCCAPSPEARGSKKT